MKRRQWKTVILGSLLLCAGTADAAGSGLNTCRIPIVRSADQVPVIDGTMQGGEWKYALAATGLISLEGPLAQRQATVYYVSDGKSVYVGAAIPAVPEGTVPEVKPGRDYAGKSYMSLSGNDRIEFKLSPPDRKTNGDFYFVADAAGHTYVEHIQGEHKPVHPEWDYKTSYDGKGWTVEMRLPLALFGQAELGGGEQWGINFNVVRLFPLKYEGLVKGPHSLGTAVFDRETPAVQIERLGNVPGGELDLVISVRGYEGAVATPKEGAYDEREMLSGGLNLEGTGHVARVAWEMTDGKGAVVAAESKLLELKPGQKLSAEFKKNFIPAPQNILNLKIEMAGSAAAFADSADSGEITVLYAATLPFVPFNTDEAALWQERLTKGTVLGSWRFNSAFFPYWEKAKIQTVFFQGKLRDQARKLRVSIRSDKGFTADREVSVVDGVMIVDNADKLLDIPIPGLPEAVYTVRGEVLDADGQLISSQERTFERKIYPWEQNTLGESRGVIKPWTPMTVEGDMVSCWGRGHKLGAAGLPVQIVSQAKDVLAVPVMLELHNVDGSLMPLRPSGDLRFTETAEDRVRWQGTAAVGQEIDLTVAGLAEYDGFTWYEVTLAPKAPVPVAGGRIVITLPEEQAQLMHFQSCWARDNFSGAVPAGDGVVFRSIDTKNYGKTGGFSPHVWLGNLTRGLSWFADSDEGWSSVVDQSALEIVRADGNVQLVMNIVARPVTLDRPRTIRFGLMATPFKPLLPIRDIQTRAVNWLSFKDGKTVVQAHMYGTYPPNFNYALIDEHVPGRRLYFNKHELGAALPERAVFDNEWGGMEPAPDFPGAPERFGPGIESRAVNRSLTDSRIDMMVCYIAELARKTTMASTYWDITGIGVGLPMLENGTAYVNPESSDLVATFDILKSRQLFKRVATVWQEVRGEPDYMEIHSTNHMGMPFYSFAYNWLNFEWLWPNEKARRPDGGWQDFIDLRPLDVFATEGVPTQFGVWINSINSGQRPEDPDEHRRILRSGRAMTLLHNHNAPGMGGSGLQPPPSIGRRDEINFAGYWDENRRVTTDQPLVRASYWHAGDKLEIVVANLDLEPRLVTVSIPLAPLGWKSAGGLTETTDEAEMDSLVKHLRASKKTEQALAAEACARAAIAARQGKSLDPLSDPEGVDKGFVVNPDLAARIPTLRVVDNTLQIILELSSHDYRLLSAQGEDL